jgi:acid phosphatase family membrane protein YuiD
MFDQLLHNYILIAALLAWGIAQALKVPIEYVSTHKLNWVLLLRAGGMPSSHSALVTAAAHSVGLFIGFNSGLFALAIVLAMIVIYDATGIRRQAGKHAELINAMLRDLATGHMVPQEQLKEVLGHTPLQAFAGVVLGLVVAQVVYWVVN